MISSSVQERATAGRPAFKIAYSREHGVLVVSLREVFSKQAVHDYCREIAQKSREHDCKNILLDARGKELCLSTVEIYQLPTVLSEYGIDHNYRHAILSDPHQKEYKFFETVAFNRSYRVKVFHEQVPALDWLGSSGQGFIL